MTEQIDEQKIAAGLFELMHQIRLRTGLPNKSWRLPPVGE
jgi:hypothetical protein